MSNAVSEGRSVDVEVAGLSRGPIAVRALAVVAILVALPGGAFATYAFVQANGAPQQAAAAALGCMCAVVPYVLLRAVQIFMEASR